MPHVAIEATIMTPLLVVQIILFPFIASTMTSYWENATTEVALQEAASQMGSTIEQLYLSLNRMEVSTGTITQTSTFPADARINDYNFLHFKTGWLENLGWSKGMALKIEKNADGSITLRKA